MQSGSNASHQTVFTSKSRKIVKLLIPRSQRRKFCFQFIFMTLLGWVLGGIASIALEKSVLQTSAAVLQLQPTWYTLIKFLGHAVFALIFAIAQALVLRRYLSAWLWVLATTTGWLVATSVSAAWINYISSIATSLNKTLSAKEMVFFGILSTISYILSGIWLGFLQWLVLRRHSMGVWWWNLLPSISYFLISVLVWLLSLAQELIPEVNRVQILYLTGQGLTAMILGVIPAMSFCKLKSTPIAAVEKGSK